MKNILLYFNFLIRGQGFSFFLFNSLNCFLAVSKSLSLLLLIPLFQQVSSNSSSSKKILPFLDNLVEFSSYHSIIAVLFMLISVQTAVKILQNKIAIQLTENFILNEKKAFLNLLNNCNWLYFKQQKSSEFYHSFLIQIDYLGNSLHRFSNLIESLFLSLAYSISVIVIAKQTSLYIFLGLIPLIIFHVFLFYKSRILGQKENENTSQEISLFIEQLALLREIKLSEKRANYFSNFISFQSKLKILNTQQAKIQNLSTNYFDILIFSSFLLVFYLLPSDLSLNLPKIGVILLFMLRLAPIFNRMLGSCVNLINSYPYYQSYDKIKNELSENQENVIKQKEQVFNSFEIYMNNISFSYSKDKPLIENFSCKIKNRQINALIGPSGCGKTTLLDILVGLIKPQGGETLINGKVLLESQLQSFQKEISYVPQQVALLNTSVIANLRFLQENIEEKEILKFIYDCNAFSFIHKLSKGLDTIIGENGIQLSGGERQRLAILKALLKNPSLLILDEATNSIDENNEQLILEYLKTKTPTMTILIVSHRKHLQEMAQHKIKFG
jgi:ABC-type multidrug transport system fused ATPase/permease subunit